MPRTLLPELTAAEVQSHNTAESCYVTLGSKVYDVTSFIDDHPGGGDLILEYAGKDVRDIMADAISHEHSEAAYDILDDCHIGFLAGESAGKGRMTNGADAATNGNDTPRLVYEATGMSREEDLTVETNIFRDYQTHKFLDLGRPLLPQLWFSGFSKEFYLQQVHRPRHYKGGEAAPLFGNFLEPLSKTAWYVIPMVWLPPVIYGVSFCYPELGAASTIMYFLIGIFFWTLVEYILHRFLFHIDT